MNQGNYLSLTNGDSYSISLSLMSGKSLLSVSIHTFAHTSKGSERVDLIDSLGWFFFKLTTLILLFLLKYKFRTRYSRLATLKGLPKFVSM